MPEPTQLSQDVAAAYLRRVLDKDGKLVVCRYKAVHHLAAILDEVAVQTLAGAMAGFGVQISMN